MPSLNPRPLSALALGLILLITSAAGAAPPAMPAQQGAGGSTDRYAIPPQPLYSALDALAEQAGLQLVYSAELVQALDSPGMSGDYTPEDALNRLLVGSGLEYRYTGPSTVTLQRPDLLEALVAEAKKPRRYAEAAEPAPKKPAASPPKKNDAGPTVLPEMTVTASPLDETSYNVPNATTATKTDTPIMETPVNIQVVPQQVLQDQQAVSLFQALRNVSNVVPSPDTGAAFNLRGFFDTRVFRDGARNPLRFYQSLEEIAHLERIEVLKGPGSILYGRMEPGGLVNQVSKQPLAAPYYALAQQFGSFDFYRTTLDAGGPVTADGTLSYRFNLAYQDAGSFVDFVESDRVFLAPVLRWDISPATQFTVQFQYRHGYDPQYPAIPILGTRPASLPRDTNLGEPLDTGTQEDQVYGGFHWSHAFNDDWALSQRFYIGYYDQFSREIFNSTFAPLSETALTLERIGSDTDTRTNYYYTTLDLTGHFTTGRIAHTLLMGGDYTREDLLQKQDIFQYRPIDIFRPIHDPRRDLLSVGDFRQDSDGFGFYMQDQAQLPFDLHVLAGFRYDLESSASRSLDVDPNGAFLFGSDSSRTEDAVTPRFGLLWRPLPQLSLYGSYTENFGSSNGRDAAGNFLPPQTAQQGEIGIKTELLDGRLTGTLAFFDLTKQNVARADPANPFFSIATGAVRHRGVELDVAGEITPGCQLIGNYAYLDSEITQDSGVDEAGNLTLGNTGNRFDNTPRHSGSLWGSCTLEQGRFKGLKFGAGVTARSQNFASLEDNSARLPGFATVDLMLGYDWKLGPSKLSLQLNVENLLDKDYFTATSIAIGGYYGAPRSFIGQVRLEY